MIKKGLFIVIEGTDGSGKTLQTALLSKALRKQGKKVQVISFPRYGQPSAKLVEQYLNGYFGQSWQVSPYQASLFYAVDRFAATKQIRNWLKQGRIVIANRYVFSNAAHQGGKIVNIKERKKYWQWLIDLEYNLLNIPEPDITFLLHVSAKLAQQLVDKKTKRSYIKSGKKRDIHENDLNHLQAAEKAYLELVKLYKLKVIKCQEGGKLLEPQKINNNLQKIIK
ncbi:dTMP kinase [Patescibacteria group bacterium]|nr:dTMP kinase [Patescibacteria group bacterium]